MHVRVDAEAPHLDHRTVEMGQRRKLVELRRVAAPDLGARAQGQQAETADKAPARRLLDQHVPTRPVEIIGIQPLGPRPAKGQRAQAQGRLEIGVAIGQSRLIATFRKGPHRSAPALPLPGGSGRWHRMRPVTPARQGPRPS